MTNFQLDVLVVGLLALHIAALALALARRGRPWLWLNALVATGLLIGVALNPRAFLPPIDWQLAALAGFEIAVLIATVFALRGALPAVIASWAVFALHLIASGLATVFALTFKITRLFRSLLRSSRRRPGPMLSAPLRKSLTNGDLHVLVLFMDAAPDMAERHGAILARLADLGMSLAEDLHARARAAKDDAVAGELSLAFHRISRSLRQTLALDAQLERERKLAAREAANDAARETLARAHRKRAPIRKAIAPLVWAEHEGDEAESRLEDLEAWISEASEDEAFLDDPVETLIARIRGNMGLAANSGDPDGETPDVVVQRSG